jgi:hypothetical protein
MGVIGVYEWSLTEFVRHLTGARYSMGVRSLWPQQGSDFYPHFRTRPPVQNGLLISARKGCP